MADETHPPRLPQLAEVLERHRGERHVVVLQDYPDPDAIASGWAHKLIANRYGIDSTLLYRGKISHQQNLALVNLLNVPLTRYSESVELKSFQGSVFVDNQGTNSGLTTLLGLLPMCVQVLPTAATGLGLPMT